MSDDTTFKYLSSTTESEEKAAADKVVAAAMAAIGDSGDSVDSSNNNNNNNDDNGNGNNSRVNEADNKAHKRKERLEQNRISARESRKRKKTMIEELQRTVIALSKENKELNDRNETLRQQLMEIGTKVWRGTVQNIFIFWNANNQVIHPNFLSCFFLFSCGAGSSTWVLPVVSQRGTLAKCSATIFRRRRCSSGCCSGSTTTTATTNG